MEWLDTWAARSLKINSSHSTLCPYVVSFPQEPKTARGRGHVSSWHWGKKARNAINRREGSSPRNIFPLHLKPNEEGFKYESLTTACWTVMLNPSHFEYVVVLHKKAYCISHSHIPKLILFNNARNIITGKWPRKYMWPNHCKRFHFAKGQDKLSWNPSRYCYMVPGDKRFPFRRAS